jgi:hypothetical protein
MGSTKGGRGGASTAGNDGGGRGGGRGIGRRSNREGWRAAWQGRVKNDTVCRGDEWQACVADWSGGPKGGLISGLYRS